MSEPRTAEALFYSLSEQSYNLGDAIPCKSAPDLFFSDDHEGGQYKQLDRLRAMCAECPLTALCAEYAIVAREDLGIWGGLTATERRALARKFPTAVRAYA